MANTTSCRLKKQLNSPNLKCHTKRMSYKTLIRPVLTYGSECWPLSKKDGNMLQIFETRIWRMIYGLINDNGIWRTKYNNKLFMLYDELEKVKVIKIWKLRWLGHFCRMQELDPSRKVTLLKPEDTRCIIKT